MKTFIAVSILSIAAVGCKTLPEPNFYPAEPSLKVVTYNINYGFAQPQKVIDFLNEASADIVCLQETHTHWEAALKEALGGIYPYAIFEEWSGAGGIAILSKHSLHNVRLIQPTAGWFPALRADVQTPFGPVQLLNVHLKPPLSDRGSVAVGAYYDAPGVHLEELRDSLATTDPDKPLVIAGDFNENEKNKAVKWLLGHSFNDALSTYDTHSKTWIWRTSYGITLTNRYDHIIINNHLRCTGARVIPVEASDRLSLP